MERYPHHPRHGEKNDSRNGRHSKDCSRNGHLAPEDHDKYGVDLPAGTNEKEEYYYYTNETSMIIIITQDMIKASSIHHNEKNELIV